MKLRTTLLGLVSIALLSLSAGLALAEDEPATDAPEFSGWCKENPGKCEQARAKHAAWCEANPEKCKEMKGKRAERAEFCKQNPEKCAEQRERFKQHRAEMKAKCEADPAKCEEMKQSRRERFKKRHGGGAPADAPAGNPSGASPTGPKNSKD